MLLYKSVYYDQISVLFLTIYSYYFPYIVYIFKLITWRMSIILDVPKTLKRISMDKMKKLTTMTNTFHILLVHTVGVKEEVVTIFKLPCLQDDVFKMSFGNITVQRLCYKFCWISIETTCYI